MSALVFDDFGDGVAAEAIRIVFVVSECFEGARLRVVLNQTQRKRTKPEETLTVCVNGGNEPNFSFFTGGDLNFERREVLFFSVKRVDSTAVGSNPKVARAVFMNGADGIHIRTRAVDYGRGKFVFFLRVLFQA